MSSSVLSVSIGNVPDTGKSEVLDTAKFLDIVYLSLTVAPPPNVIDPPPDTPAPVTEYCAALEGLDASVNVVSAPLDTAVLITVRSPSAKNSNGTVNAVCQAVAVYCILGDVSDIANAIYLIPFSNLSNKLSKYHIFCKGKDLLIALAVV